LVRQIIAAHLAKSEPTALPLNPEQACDTVRVELRLPHIALQKATELAEGRFLARNYCLTSIILACLGVPQLQGDEIEVLRCSNYELSKVGGNINQVTKAFEALVKWGWRQGSGGWQKTSCVATGYC